MHIESAVEVSGYFLHGTPNLSLPYGVRSGLDYENSVLGIEIDHSVKVLSVDRLVCSVDEKRDWVFAHCCFLRRPASKVTGAPTRCSAS